MTKYRDIYEVACPFCTAPIGKACWERSRYRRTGEKKYIAPHQARVNARDTPVRRLLDDPRAEEKIDTIVEGGWPDE